MLERQDLGTPDSHPPGHICPACERQFTKLEDFPRIYLVSVSLVPLKDIPTVIPHWSTERLLTSPEPNNKMPVVPNEVVEHFKANFGEDKFAHDGYIYERPYTETLAFLEQVAKFPERFANLTQLRGSDYRRSLNWFPEVWDLLNFNDPLREYLTTLKGLEGQELRTEYIMPNWGSKIPDSSGLQLLLTEPRPKTGMTHEEVISQKEAYEQQKASGGLWLADIGLWSKGPNRGSMGGPSLENVIGIGQIAYQGKINEV